MTNVLVLAAWIATGVLLSVRLTSPGESPWAVAPIAAVLGPLWLSVVVDQRAVRRPVEATTSERLEPAR